MSVEPSKSSPNVVGDRATEWLYPIVAPIGETHSPYGLPFAVGVDRTLVYGSLPTMVYRSNLISALEENNRAEVTQATIEKPITLLSDVKGFDIKIPSSFKIVWNYLNGMHTCSDSDIEVWPYPDMTFDDKYMVIYFALQLGVIDNAYISKYIEIFVNDFVKEQPTAADQDHRGKVIVGMREIIMNIVRDHWRISDKLSTQLPYGDFLDIVYGPIPPIIPTGHGIILDHDGDNTYTYEYLKNLRNGYVQAYYGVNDERYLAFVEKSIGTWPVKSITQLDAPTITGSKVESFSEKQLADGSIQRIPASYTPSPYGLSSHKVEQYFKHASKLHMLITATTPTGDIGFFESPDGLFWIAPALNRDNPDKFVHLRLFSA